MKENGYYWDEMLYVTEEGKELPIKIIESREALVEKVHTWKRQQLGEYSKEELIEKLMEYFRFNQSSSCWRTSRNYEIEYEATVMSGEYWMIDEPCPYNGHCCSYGELKKRNV